MINRAKQFVTVPVNMIKTAFGVENNKIDHGETSRLG
jgi:hypothetical protein